jgi:hypothetical protein
MYGNVRINYTLRLADFYLKPGEPQHMYYIDDKGELFVGRAKDVDIGRIYEVEVSEKRLGNCYRYITAWREKLDDRGA